MALAFAPSVHAWSRYTDHKFAPPLRCVVALATNECVGNGASPKGVIAGVPLGIAPGNNVAQVAGMLVGDGVPPPPPVLVDPPPLLVEPPPVVTTVTVPPSHAATKRVNPMIKMVMKPRAARKPLRIVILQRFNPGVR